MVNVSYRAVLSIAKRLRELAEQLVALAGQLVNAIEEANGENDDTA
jgi:hypothetical protein